MMFGNLIRALSFMAAVTASSYFGEITPNLEDDIEVSKTLNLEKTVANLTASNGHGRLTITRNLEDGSIKVNRYEHCIAYIEFQDGEPYEVDHYGAHLLKDEKNPFKEVRFMLGDASAHTGILTSDFGFARNWEGYEPTYTIYTVPLPVDQESKEEKKLKMGPKRWRASPRGRDKMHLRTHLQEQNRRRSSIIIRTSVI